MSDIIAYPIDVVDGEEDMPAHMGDTYVTRSCDLVVQARFHAQSVKGDCKPQKTSCGATCCQSKRTNTDLHVNVPNCDLAENGLRVNDTIDTKFESYECKHETDLSRHFTCSVHYHRQAMGDVLAPGDERSQVACNTSCAPCEQQCKQGSGLHCPQCEMEDQSDMARNYGRGNFANFRGSTVLAPCLLDDVLMPSPTALLNPTVASLSCKVVETSCKANVDIVSVDNRMVSVDEASKVSEQHVAADYLKHGKTHVHEADGPGNCPSTDDVNALLSSVSFHSGDADANDFAHQNMCCPARSEDNFHPPCGKVGEGTGGLYAGHDTVRFTLTTTCVPMSIDDVETVERSCTSQCIDVGMGPTYELPNANDVSKPMCERPVRQNMSPGESTTKSADEGKMVSSSDVCKQSQGAYPL